MMCREKMQTYMQINFVDNKFEFQGEHREANSFSDTETLQ